MKILLANDHGAFDLSKQIKQHLEEQGHEVKHLGIVEGMSADSADMAELCCNKYLKGGYDFGILCCGTGIGISIAANKINGIRCALPQNIFAAKMSKQHNNANFIAFGGRIDYQESPLHMLDIFMNESFDGIEKRVRRVSKVMDLEKKQK